MEELKNALKTSNSEVCILSLQCLDHLCRLSSGLLSETVVIQLIRSILYTPNSLEMRKACYNLLTTVTTSTFSSSSAKIKLFTTVVSELLKNLKPDDLAIQAINKGIEVSCHLQWLVQQKSRLKELSGVMKENLTEGCLDLFTGNSVYFPLIAEVILGTEIDKPMFLLILNRQKPDVKRHALDFLHSLISDQDPTGFPSFPYLPTSPTPLSSPYKSPINTPSPFNFTFDDISTDRKIQIELTPRKSIHPVLYGRVRSVDEKTNGREVRDSMSHKE